MIRAIQHIPGFVSGIEPNVSEVADTAALLALDWVQAYARPPHEDFYRWSYSEPHLMAEYAGGTRWWVVAMLKGDEPELPTWPR